MTHEVTVPYEADGVRVELPAVCSATEDSARCWGPKGQPSPEFTKRFEVQFLNQPTLSVPVRPGRKIRMAVGSIEKGFGGDRVSIELQDSSMGGVIPWYGGSPQWTGGRRKGETARYVIGGLTDRTGTARALLRRPMAPSEPTPMKIGAKLRYAGWDLEVRQIGPTADGEGTFGSFAESNQALWQVRCISSGDAERLPPTLHALDADGLSIEYVDSKGRPTTVRPGSSRVIVGGKAVDRRNDSATASLMMVTRGAQLGGGCTIITNVDPRAIDAFRTLATQSETIAFTGIPLEPDASSGTVGEIAVKR